MQWSRNPYIETGKQKPLSRKICLESLHDASVTRAKPERPPKLGGNPSLVDKKVASTRLYRSTPHFTGPQGLRNRKLRRRPGLGNAAPAAYDEDGLRMGIPSGREDTGIVDVNEILFSFQLVAAAEGEADTTNPNKPHSVPGFRCTARLPLLDPIINTTCMKM